MYANHQSNHNVHGPNNTTTHFSSSSLTPSCSDLHGDFVGRIIKYSMVGTLGLLSPIHLQAIAATSNWPISQIKLHDAAAAKQSSVSASELAHVRKVLKISITELARVFGVTRQAVHEWAKGGALSTANAEKLSNLVRAADVLAETGLEMTPQLLRRKIGAAPSILDAVMQGADVVDLARKLTDTLSRETQQRERLALRLAGRKKSVPAETEFATPHFPEDS